MTELQYDIKSIDFKEINSPEEIHIKFKSILKFPEYYGKNWDAFWDCITGDIKMPTNLFFYNINEYKEKYPEDAEKLIRIIFEYNDYVKKKIIDLDYTDKLNPNELSSIFKSRPFQYGLRGDQYLWNDLEEHFQSVKNLDSEIDLVKEILSTTQSLTNNSLTQMKNFYVEKYNSGGMSGGTVCSQFWIKEGIPLLISRYREIKKSW